MLEKSFGLFFFLKQSKTERDERYVYIRITVDGIAKELSLKRTWDPDRWDQKLGRAKGNKEETLKMNSYLDSYQMSVYSAKAKLISEQKEITAEAIKMVMLGRDVVKKFIIEIFQEHNDKIEKLMENDDYAYATLQRYNTARDHVKSFIHWKYNKQDLLIGELNYEFITEYSFWLRTIKKCGHNTTMKYISNLKKIVSHAFRVGWLRADPFAEFNTTVKDVKRDPLTKKELDAIAKKNFSIKRLELVRDIFLFSCYTGLAYIDVKKLRRSHIITMVSGEQWICQGRQKTDTEARLPLLPEALRIMEKYKAHPDCITEDVVLPILSNQKMNAYLKEIADLAGVEKRLTFHIARHTFATTVTLANGVPLESVSKMLGHKNIKQTQLYAKVIDLKLQEDMSMLRKKLSKVG